MTEQATEEKNLFEMNKQLTTLSAGSAVLIATFLKDIFPKTDAGALNLVDSAKVAIFLAFLAFFVATACAVFGMLPIIPQLNLIATALSVLTFMLGIAIFVVVVNLSLSDPDATLANPEATEPVESSP